MAGEQSFLNAFQNYPDLKGQQTNLYKCFLPQAWMYGNPTGISSFIHPDGVFDDPKGGILRSKLYQKLRYHFKFQNEKVLFDIMHTRSYSLNVYINNLTSIAFDCIFDLYLPETIAECFDKSKKKNAVPGIKDKNGDWCTTGHPDRLLHITKKELALFAKIFDASDKWGQARLPVLHCRQLLDVMTCIADQDAVVGDLDGIASNILLDETQSHVCAEVSGFVVP